MDVYDRAGGLGERTVLAHAIHLSDRELARLIETGTRVAHCPASNLFIGAGVMPLARYLGAGLALGLGSDVSGGPEASIFSVMPSLPSWRGRDDDHSSSRYHCESDLSGFCVPGM